MSTSNANKSAAPVRPRKRRKVTVAGTARLRYLGSSAQKTRLVVNEIRGKRVDAARSFLRSCRKAVARDVLKLLVSAVHNVENRGDKAPAVDPEDLYVTLAHVDRGPMMKRIQPAPMGRAYPILKRYCHITIELGTVTRG